MSRPTKSRARKRPTRNPADRGRELADIARSYLENEAERRHRAVVAAMKAEKARCLAAAREHFSRAERTGEADTDPLLEAAARKS